MLSNELFCKFLCLVFFLTLHWWNLWFVSVHVSICRWEILYPWHFYRVSVNRLNRWLHHFEIITGDLKGDRDALREGNIYKSADNEYELRRTTDSSCAVQGKKKSPNYFSKKLVTKVRSWKKVTIADHYVACEWTSERWIILVILHNMEAHKYMKLEAVADILSLSMQPPYLLHHVVPWPIYVTNVFY